MHNHNTALADAHVADVQNARTHSTATVPPRRHRRNFRVLAVVGLAATAALAPTGALARPSHDTATPAQDLPGLAKNTSLAGPPPRQDKRSPDTRDAAAQTAQPRQDLRSADARDAAEGRGTYNSPDVMIVKVSQPSPAKAPDPSSAGGIDWADAGIGAGSLLGLSLIGCGGAFVLVHRRRAAHGAPPVAGL